MVKVMRIETGRFSHNQIFRIGPDIFKAIIQIGKRLFYKPLFTQLHYDQTTKSWKRDARTGKKIHKI